ncbi:hypothetical protein BDN70DRAFT_930144 [Pholiota conissans]|uniref:F-box domain-containing protein n=1 Tax=Pholiota conissans TaxID=109636 RepID=A0A9P5Z983_9AGAR|nr:hypothetical protein BDN70DRAFT_930144 [Pholiota conissans]
METNEHYLLAHSEGPRSRSEIMKRVEDINLTIQILQQELEISQPTRGEYPLPEDQMLVFLRHRRDEYLSMISASNRLPLGVLIRIFSFTIWADEALNYARVCRLWRDAIFKMPRDLLQGLTVFISPGGLARSSRTLKSVLKANMIKSISNGQLSVCLLHENRPFWPKHMVSIDLSLAHTATWLRQLYTSAHSVPALFGNPKTRCIWENLQDLVIDCSNFPAFPNPNFLAQRVHLDHMQSLRRLSIHVNGYLTVSRLVLPKGLEYLHLDDALAHPSDISRALSVCKSVNTLILSCHLNWKCDDPNCPRLRPCSDKRIELPLVTQLVLMGGDRSTALLSWLKLPGLLNFRLARYGNTPLPGLRYLATGNDILRLINASNCRIQRLELHSVHISNTDTEACFSALQRSLSALFISDDGGLSSLLNFFRKPFDTPAKQEKLVAKPFASNKRDKPLKFHVPFLVKLFVSTTSPSNWPREAFDDFVNVHRSNTCMKKSELKYTTQLEPFNLEHEHQNLDISLFSSLRENFKVTIKAPYMPRS